MNDSATYWFYISKPWMQLRHTLIMQRGNICARCKKMIMKECDIIGHHVIPITVDNVHDENISLNPDNVELICKRCHNQEHHGYKERAVYIIYGAPLSGKTTTANQLSSYGDLIVDIDNLWQAITGQPRYEKPEALKQNVFRLRDELYDQIYTRLGHWSSAYVIAGLPRAYERSNLSKRLGAQLIYCESTQEECIQRLYNNPDGRDIAEWEEYINRWFQDYAI